MAEFEVGVPLMSEPEAKASAKATAKKLKRDTTTASCSVVGDPSIKAGADLTFEGVRPGVDGLAFVVKTVRHSFSKKGFTSAIDAELKVTGGGGAAADPAAGGGGFVIGQPTT